MYIEGWVVKNSQAHRLLVDESLRGDFVSRFGIYVGDEVYSVLG